MNGTALDKLIEDFGRLSLDDREFAADLIKKQLIEAKREAIYRRSKTAMTNLDKKKVKSGSVNELRNDLEKDYHSDYGEANEV